MSESLREWDDQVGGFVAPADLGEYAARYAEHFAIQRHDGIVELRMHTANGPAVFSLGLKNTWSQVLAMISADPANEVLIITGTGDRWIGGIHPPSFGQPVPSWPADAAYQHAYLDGLKMLENLVFGVDIPTIGAINGPGIRTELALLCDLTLCTPNNAGRRKFRRRRPVARRRDAPGPAGTGRAEKGGRLSLLGRADRRPDRPATRTCQRGHRK
ncbi:Clp protease/crotonase-like domain-containing protein [Fodinicola feengrottensis]|uniref:hypothetical protein n=1 Tax=Fodinicola feengrottensis TaxID=435914 RepID=UPI002442833A|nr:hypothetical protein [Fodinicola feengrottensis]